MYIMYYVYLIAIRFNLFLDLLADDLYSYSSNSSSSSTCMPDKYTAVISALLLHLGCTCPNRYTAKGFALLVQYLSCASTHIL
jgi:hypothetical protein